MLKVQKEKILWANEPKSYSGAAATKNWVSLKDASHLTIIIVTGAWAGGTAAVTLKQATDVSGTGSKALALAKYWHDEAAGGTLVETAAASNTFDLDTANKLYVIEVDAAELDVNGGFDCIALDVASPGANADFYAAAYVLSGLRYGQATPPSAEVD
jgi:hypothetical protein